MKQHKEPLAGKHLLTAMNYLEDEIVEAYAPDTSSTTKEKINTVHSQKTAYSKIAVKWAAAAAVVLLFLGGSAAYAAKYGIFRTNPGWESGYHVAITSRRVTEDEFSKEVRAVKQELLEDIAATEDTEHPNVFGWIRDFDSVAEAAAFIGHDQLKAPDTPGILEQTGVVVLGNNEADLLYVRLFSRSNLYDRKFMLHTSALICTTTMFPENGDGIKDDGLIYKDEIYLTKTGKEAVIITPEQYQGNIGIQGYLVNDCVIYQLWIHCQEKNHDEAMQIMKDWLNQF